MKLDTNFLEVGDREEHSDLNPQQDDSSQSWLISIMRDHLHEGFTIRPG